MTPIIPKNNWSSSDTCDGSSIKMPSAKILELATAQLEWIEQYRQNKKKMYVEEIRQDYINSRWRKFWRMKEPTFQQVLEEVEKCRGFMDTYFSYVMIDWSYSDHEKACRRLINACSDTDEIFISTNDYALIK